MPGVTVRTATRVGPSVPARAPSSTYFLVGLTERGPVDRAVPIRSMGEYADVLGARTTYGAVYDDLRMFFEEGGTRAYVARVAGAAAVAGTLTLLDRAGTPLGTVRIDAVSPGSWSTGITVQVEAGSQADTYRIVVRHGDSTETFDNLADPAAAVTALAASRFVRATNLGSATAAPNNLPAIVGPVALSSGNDDRAAVTAATYLAALARFGAELGAGAVAIPGMAHSAVGAGLIAHGRANKRIALLAPPAAQSPDQAIAAAATLRATAGSEFAGLFYPWVLVPDEAGGTRTVSPEGYVAAVRARAVESEGPWRAPAGQIAAARYLAGVERELTRAEGDRLDGNAVSAIRAVAGRPRLYGWRSLALDELNFALLTGQDVLNLLVAQAEERLEQFVFRTIDGRGHLFAEAAAELTGIAEPIRAAGGLYERLDDEGNVLDRGYGVDVGPSVNTPASLAENKLRAALSVRVSPTGALVEVTIVKAGLNAGV